MKVYQVAVIGGGEVGCELSTELSMQGKDVTVIEALDDILQNGQSFVANEQNLRYLVEHSDTTVMTGTKLAEVLDEGVVVERDGKKETIECDSVVFAAGFRANHDLYEGIKDAGFEMRPAGRQRKTGAR